MGLFSDIQHQISMERRQARLQTEQAEAPRPTPFPTPQTPIQTPAPEPERPAPVSPQTPDVAAAIQRIKTDTERITRRNMKDAVAAYLAQSCASNPDLAHAVTQPQKTMVKCFGYINRKAKEYAEQERHDNNITENGVYGCDVPDDLVYGWAVAYFTDPNADKPPERKTPPKPTARAKTKSKAEKKDPAPPPEGEQMTILEGTA